MKIDWLLFINKYFLLTGASSGGGGGFLGLLGGGYG